MFLKCLVHSIAEESDSMKSGQGLFFEARCVLTQWGCSGSCLVPLCGLGACALACWSHLNCHCKSAPGLHLPQSQLFWVLVLLFSWTACPLCRLSEPPLWVLGSGSLDWRLKMTRGAHVWGSITGVSSCTLNWGVGRRKEGAGAWCEHHTLSGF